MLQAYNIVQIKVNILTSNEQDTIDTYINNKYSFIYIYIGIHIILKSIKISVRESRFSTVCGIGDVCGVTRIY